MISVGIDVSKGKSTVCILRPNGEIVQPVFEVMHTVSEQETLVEKLMKLQKTEELRIVMEATGIYGLPIMIHLQKAGFFVSAINPLVMKRYNGESVRHAKTDKLDAKHIANYGIDHWFRLIPYQPRQETYDELCLLGRQYAAYMTQLIQAKQNLLWLLERTMPGITRHLRNGHADCENNKLSDFAERYWHYDNITAISEEAFTADFLAWAKEKGYHRSVSKAHAIYESAHEGIPTLSSSRQSTKLLILEAVGVQKIISNTLRTIITRMQELASCLPEFSVIMQMPGVGAVLGPRLIAEIGDIRRFRSASALIAFTGIDAPPYQSGTFTATKRSISKRGSALLRKTGYELMQCLKRLKPQNCPVYAYICKKEAEGKAKKSAKIAGLNKFLRIYYARVKEVYQQFEVPLCS
ncbi:MAG: IS110 family transposase [Bacteroidia bacterium]|nr:IS110 family transposase [Bacteroidia bacterium]